MSEERTPKRRPRGHGPMGAMMPAERARDFKGSLKRLSGYLKPHRVLLAIVALLSIAGVVLTIAGPKILGRATNILFEGVIEKQLPPGLGKEQIIAMLKAAGRDQMAEMVAGMNIVPGAGVDFRRNRPCADHPSRNIHCRILLSAGYSITSWQASLSEPYGLRKEADAKLARLPLKYYDSNTRGEILSRVTNDIDNIASTLQQSLMQLITALFTVIGVLIMMFSISPLLAVIALATLLPERDRHVVHCQALTEAIH